MSDTHQAIYDAVRSKISGGDISSAVRDVLWQQMDISHLKAMIQGDAAAIGWEMQRPSVLFRPTLLQDGNAWLAIYGDLPTGCVGTGASPAEAMAAFDKAWNAKLSEREPS